MIEVPRLTHNAKLADDYITSCGLPPRWPRASDQIECLPIQKEKLKPFGYNPAIIDHDGSIFMCYRYHENTLATKLAVARLKDNGEVDSGWELPILGVDSAEDPKWFRKANTLCVSWVLSKFPRILQSIVKFGVFAGTRIESIVQPWLGNNDWSGVEKNWVFWEFDGQLFCLYRCHPSQQVFRIEDGRGIALNETPAPRWPYGEIRGGTPPIEYEGKLLRFFHSTLWNEFTRQRWRYYLGACLMEPHPPFETIAVSKNPIIYGSEADDLAEDERKRCFHRKLKVVFPGGVVTRPDHWLLSFGANDCECLIAKVRPEHLNL